MKTYFYSIGLHKEGGLNILNKFIKKNKNYIYILDKRLFGKIEVKNSYFKSNNFFFMFIYLLYLKFKLTKEDHLIFLNGLPPILKFKCSVSVMFQNANLFKEFYKINSIKWLFSKDFLRYIDFRIGLKNVDNWFVFSPVSKKILSKYLKNYINLKIINIFENYKSINFDNNQKHNYDFIYPASLMNHKNHQLLIDVLIKLSKKNIYPKVLLTLSDKEKERLGFNKLKNKHKIKLFNFHDTNQERFKNIYKECKALLYLSSNETIALPIIEANMYRLFIIAPKLPYSEQFIKPDISFDIDKKNDLLQCIELSLKNNFKIKNHRKENFKFQSNITLNNFFNKIL